MGFSLRDYQQRAHDACREAFSAGFRRLLLVAPPRSGKGTIIAYQAVEAAKKGAQVLIWVHKNELVYEIQKRLKEQMGVDCGLIIAGEPIRKSKRIQVMSVMTGIRRDLSWLNPHLIITDETHRILSTSQKEGLLAQWPGVRLIGYTATPFRNDKRFMSEVFDKLIQITTWAEQEERGVLVPAVVYAPKGAASLDGIKLRMSSDGMDYDKKEMSRRFSEDKVLEALYQKWVQYTRGKLQTMCFNVDKANNKAVCDYFKAKGVSAVSVDESTPKAQRAAILKKFYEGPFAKEPIMFLCNIALFSEGIDCPTVKCVILNYATKSFAKLIQSAARGSGALYGPDKEWLKLEDGRPYKKNVIIIDMGSNFQRHECTLETYDAFGFSLDGVVKKGEAPTRVCPECDLTVHISKKECPGCGYVFPPSLMKEEKKLASEVEFGSLKTDQLLALKIMNTLPSDEHVRVACPTHWLRLTAVVNGKGDPTLYAHQMLLKREHEKIKADFGLRKIEHVAQLLDISTPGNKRRFTQKLDELEKRKATHSTYLRISGNVLGV